jgi:flavin reductase (DIM6/NTAB) family NADH-FMN oxidoreductase RutF
MPTSSRTAPPGPDTVHLRRCLGRFPTGVTVVAYDSPDGPRGATVNAFMSVSLDPALIVVSLGCTTRAAQALTARPFTVNVLAADQVDVALQFAGRPRPGARVRWRDRPDADAPPALAATAATFWCRPWRRHEAGDHVLTLGEVETAELSDREPLLFSDSGFAMPGLPLFDGPLVHGRTRWPVPSWSRAVCALHRADAY